VRPVPRYTRWAPDLHTFGQYEYSQLNQVELLVALSHEAESRWSPAGRRVSLGAVLGWGLNAEFPSSTYSGYYEYPGSTAFRTSCSFRRVTGILTSPFIL
jgi:hypothetical protein